MKRNTVLDSAKLKHVSRPACLNWEQIMLSGTSVSYVPRQVPDKIRAVLLISMSNIISGMLDLKLNRTEFLRYC